MLGVVGTSTVFLHQARGEYPAKPRLLLRAEEQQQDKVPPATDQCVLVVGTTGTGKSSTIGRMTGQEVAGSCVCSCSLSAGGGGGQRHQCDPHLPALLWAEGGGRPGVGRHRGLR